MWLCQFCKALNHLSTDQDEADTIIFLHSLEIATSGATLHMISPVTDVFVLALRHVPELIPDSCIIRGVGQSSHTVHLVLVYNALGYELADALPGFHCFTGCHTTIFLKRQIVQLESPTFIKHSSDKSIYRSRQRQPHQLQKLTENSKNMFAECTVKK